MSCYRNCSLLLTLAAALSSPSAAADQNEDLTRLREDAARQRQDLEGTEARIRALEQQTGTSHSDSAPATQLSPVQLKKNWSQIERGTPQEKVETLLGTPEKVLRIDGALVWYYVYPGIGPGSVFFNASGKVSSRQPPSFGWW